MARPAATHAGHQDQDQDRRPSGPVMMARAGPERLRRRRGRRPRSVARSLAWRNALTGLASRRATTAASRPPPPGRRPAGGPGPGYRAASQGPGRGHGREPLVVGLHRHREHLLAARPPRPGWRGPPARATRRASEAGRRRPRRPPRRATSRARAGAVGVRVTGAGHHRQAGGQALAGVADGDADPRRAQVDARATRPGRRGTPSPWPVPARRPDPGERHDGSSPASAAPATAPRRAWPGRGPPAMASSGCLPPPPPTIRAASAIRSEATRSSPLATAATSDTLPGGRAAAEHDGPHPGLGPDVGRQLPQLALVEAVAPGDHEPAVGRRPPRPARGPARAGLPGGAPSARPGRPSARPAAARGSRPARRAWS